ncbi:hypothetical protein C8A03DRAFT_34162 [Achaetomium macrosporum]|uniref:Uncharacterized protein n=1 Tax=Achaetomium macrosporum TaxID=79813 RepID=A0AAN7CBC0_9PEZI|nr:hypothetical protein C8A03DRAFT_34162 [Achaetomium macrosporum]
MGNLCSTERDADPFSQPGRRLGEAPAAPTSASVPASATSPRRVGGPPRTLGGSEAGEAGASSRGDGSEARLKAAAAAEARFQGSKQGGKLQAQLDRQRGMTDAKVLQQASETARRQRDLDESTSALNHS